MSTPVSPSTPGVQKLTAERRLELRTLNLAAREDRPNVEDLASLDASLKKNTAFIKRLRNIAVENFESIRTEFLTLKLSKYIEEAVSAILENRFRTAGDFLAAIEIISALHQRYADFAGSFISALDKEIESPESAAEDKPAWLTRQRQLLRLQAELVLVGILEDPLVVLKNLQCLLPESDAIGSTRLPLATSFAKALGQYFIKLDLIDKYPLSAFLSEGMRSKFSNLFASYFRAMCRLLVREHQRLRSLQANSRFHYENRGDLSTKQSSQLQESMDRVEKLRANLQALADLLDTSLPELEGGSEADEFEVVEGKIVFADPTIAKREVKTLVYDSEEDRSFYEDIIDLKDLVPDLLLPAALGAASGSRSGAESPNSTAVETAHREEELNLSSVAEIDPDSIANKKIDETVAVEDRSKASLISAFFAKLPAMRSIALADQTATSYVYIHSNAVQRRLADTLIDLPYRRLDLLPFIGRLLATLRPYFPEIANSVISSLVGQFTFLFHQKSPIIGTRSRVCRYIGELAKFGVLPQSTAYALLKRTIVDDLTNYNIDMVSTILESCGRYLYHQPESHKRLLNLFEIIRKKQAQGMEASQIIMLDNAIYLCDPSATVVAEPKVAKPPRLAYALKLIRVDLGPDNVAKVGAKLLGFPWEQPECRSELRRALGKPWKVQYSCIAPLASLLHTLQPYYPDFAIDLVDGLLEEIRSCLEMNQIKLTQRLLMSIKYVGELANAQTVPPDVIYSILHTLIIHGHEGGIPRLSVPCPGDPPTGHVRIRATCLLLQTCPSLLLTNPLQLEQFFTLFEYYLATKSALPMDVDFIIDDAFAGLERVRTKGTLESSVDRLVEMSSGALSFLYEDLEHQPIVMSSDDFFGEDYQQLRVPLINSGGSKSDEFDRALSGMVSLGLEERKLEKRVSAFDTPLPISLVGSRSGQASLAGATPPTPSTGPPASTLKLLVKRRNKVTLRDVVSPDRIPFERDSRPESPNSASASKKKGGPGGKLTIQLTAPQRNS